MHVASEDGTVDSGKPELSWQQRAVTWRGVPVMKNPADMIMLAELLHEVRPAVVVETGGRNGGSALFVADMLELAGIYPLVVTVEIGDFAHREDSRIVYLRGSSTDLGTVAHVTTLVNRYTRGGALAAMVLLDSDHSAAHVYDELVQYAPLVTPGSYLVVEDTNLTGEGVQGGFVSNELAPGDEGPAAALATWLPQQHGLFVPDPKRERFGTTFNPGGWIRRLGVGAVLADYDEGSK